MGRRARESEGELLQRVIVRGQKTSSAQWLIPEPMWFMASPRLFCRSLWCHITQAVQTTSLISVLVNRRGGHACASRIENENVFLFEFCIGPSCHEIKWILWSASDSKGRWRGALRLDTRGSKSNTGKTPLSCHYDRRKHIFCLGDVHEHILNTEHERMFTMIKRVINQSDK